MPYAELSPSTLATKKWQVRLWTNERDTAPRLVHFGARGYSDFTQHQDPTRRDRYLARHRTRENWKASGWRTPGFWARWVLWNQPTVHASLWDIQRRFGIHVRTPRG